MDLDKGWVWRIKINALSLLTFKLGNFWLRNFDNIASGLISGIITGTIFFLLSYLINYPKC